jgi:hypothetical protein
MAKKTSPSAYGVPMFVRPKLKGLAIREIFEFTVRIARVILLKVRIT